MQDRDYPPLRDELREQLAAFLPSRDGEVNYWPSEVKLVDGTKQDRVYVVRANEYIQVWGVWPEEAPDKRSVPIENVVAIRESSKRLPPSLADKLYATGETGMGYLVFTVVLRDGRHLPFATGNAVDFPALPESVLSGDIVDVLPHAGLERLRDRQPSADESAADYAWCLFGP